MTFFLQIEPHRAGAPGLPSSAALGSSQLSAFLAVRSSNSQFSMLNTQCSMHNAQFRPPFAALSCQSVKFVSNPQAMHQSPSRNPDKKIQDRKIADRNISVPNISVSPSSVALPMSIPTPLPPSAYSASSASSAVSPLSPRHLPMPIADKKIWDKNIFVCNDSAPNHLSILAY